MITRQRFSAEQGFLLLLESPDSIVEIGCMDVFYAARRSFRRSWIFFVGFGGFSILGIFLALFTGEAQALLMSGFGGVMLAFLFFQVGAPGYGCVLGDRALTLKNTFSKKIIPLDDLAFVTFLDENAAHDFLYSLQAQIVGATRNYDLSAWWSAIRKNRDIYKFQSISIVSSSSSMGTANNIRKFDVMADGSYLLIGTKAGERYLVTPLDADGLYRAMLAHGVRSTSTPPGLRPDAMPEPESSFSGRRLVRALALISSLVFIPLVAFVVWWTVDAQKRSEQPASKRVTGASDIGAVGGAVWEDGWLGNDALRLRVTPPFFAPADFSLEQKTRFLRELAVSEASWSFATFVLKEYSQARKIRPADIPWNELNQELRDWALTLPIHTMFEHFGSEGAFSDFGFEYRNPGLKAEVRKRIESEIKKK